MGSVSSSSGKGFDGAGNGDSAWEDGSGGEMVLALI